MRGVVVAGIGTDVGKTIVAAALCEATGFNYWKPIASGSEDGPTDDERITSLLRDGDRRILPTTYSFTKSLSPHVAASLDGQVIELSRLGLPPSDKPVVVELAGGVAVPLNETQTNLDFLEMLGLPVIVVSRHYLGSINHTLLTIDALRFRQVHVAGVVFNGPELPDTERIIARLSKATTIGKIPHLDRIDRGAISSLASGFDLSAF